MSEEESSNVVKGTIEAATGLVKAVPIYEDAVQPVAKQIGKSLEIVGKAVNAALMPIQGLVWGAEAIQAFLKDTLPQKLKDVPPEDIVSPKPNIAGPAIESLRYAGHEDSLKDMYANLLAAAMNVKRAGGAHPAFVEIIKQLTSDEAKLMQFFVIQEIAFPLVTVKAVEKNAGGAHWEFAVNVSLLGEAAGIDLIEFTPSYLDNLARLGLIELKRTWSYTEKGLYSELENSTKIAMLRKEIEEEHDRIFSMERGAVALTNFGEQFGDICILGVEAPESVAEKSRNDPS
ncbi:MULTISPECIES: DUF4393 domain-containing protein [Pseudomonas syringae group]|uniref:DUF4393 domain-containing protein n=2 Tax=Pseudomonas syringae group TaxID=136849 RepID=A0A2K4WWK9_PSESX|nr:MULTISPECIES: DUF4393 domain-containing protein [Pseudomonas syringae group]KWS56740.1 hypothetical protein AL056_27455 [Pseudomonas amygdali pv. morsprunorum]KWS62755.1 hypothetical protein AL054_04135 [Pseudomonas amygdali pv. morsprunorum]MDT3222634.1 DUF4393 domain-containing protein [Pseudomonas amygdali pv. morsprunorum]MDT3242324.1 DUF4393 domain-containing protein [Pseudomonas amygdali pv. morsprunorum]MDT3265260.1 DUF4393 domain-containing protein [Pseudomonas amygdali pv. morsprun